VDLIQIRLDIVLVRGRDDGRIDLHSSEREVRWWGLTRAAALSPPASVTVTGPAEAL
jgi:hypothetical protein